MPARRRSPHACERPTTWRTITCCERIIEFHTISPSQQPSACWSESRCVTIASSGRCSARVRDECECRNSEFIAASLCSDRAGHRILVCAGEVLLPLADVQLLEGVHDRIELG